MTPAKKSAKRSCNRSGKTAAKRATKKSPTKSVTKKSVTKKLTSKRAAKKSAAKKSVAKQSRPKKVTAPSVRASLAKYRAKRDFTVTAEPSGDKGTSKGRALAFVIQKHEASHLHFDLRLEVDGVMKSWAVPKGPSIDPSVRRLAMEVEDHPIAYNTFEGTIPQGEYGGGTVMLWDRGTYTPDEVAEDESPNDAAGRAIKSGKLAFTFQGKRLKGSFALVRTSRGDDKPQWLLIKHKDSAAKAGSDIVAKHMTSVESGRRMEAIAAGKTPRAK